MVGQYDNFFQYSSQGFGTQHVLIIETIVLYIPISKLIKAFRCCVHIISCNLTRKKS
jgi:hypothetical protein